MEDIEAEFWRIVETPDEVSPKHLNTYPALVPSNTAWLLLMFEGCVKQVVESLYGQDLDSGHHGSGFPLPPFRRKLLEEHLKSAASPADEPQSLNLSPEEEAYSEHCWNINNLPRCKVFQPCLSATIRCRTWTVAS